MFTEQLESRRHFSMVASLGGDTLVVYGDDNGNDFKVELSADSSQELVRVKYPGSSTYSTIYSVATSKVNHILVYGKAGADRIDLSNAVAQTVKVNAGHGSDYILVGGADAVVYGDYDPATASDPDDNASDTFVDCTGGNTRLFGQGGNDHFYTGFEHTPQGMYNTLSMWGGDGNDTFDTLVGQPGRTTKAYGGAGNDTLRADGTRYVDFYGNSGTDLADFSSAKMDLHTEFNSFRSTGDRYNPAKRRILLGSDVENANGGAGNDEMFGSKANNVFHGKGGNDLIYGKEGNDTLYGDDGSDGLYGGFGDDVIHGGAEMDVLYGDSGTDTLYGDTDKDTFYTQDGYTDHIIADFADSIGSKDSYDIITAS